MKRIQLLWSLLLSILLLSAPMYGQVRISDDNSTGIADPSAILHLETELGKGLLLPRVATTTAVTNQKAGMVVFSIADDCVMYYNGAKWISLCTSFSITGTVKDGNGNPVTGVTVSDDKGKTTTTDANGNFTLPDYSYGDSPTIMPGKTGYMFTSINVPEITGDTSLGNITGTVHTYTITYDSNNGIPGNQTKTMEHGALFTDPTTAPTRTGYTLTGWNTMVDGTGTTYTINTTKITGAITVYAQWKIIEHTITYNGNNGIPALQTKTFIHGAMFETPVSIPTRANYIFAGWNTATDGTGSAYIVGSTAITAGITVYAQWATTTLGAGSLYGRTCFDINKSNWGEECGSQTDRALQTADFSQESVCRQTYTFKATAANTSNLRFYVADDPNIACVASTDAGTKGVSGSLTVGSEYKMTVTFKNTLSNPNSPIVGLKRADAAKINVIATYFDGSKDVSIILQINIQDCVCCGAKTIDGGWLAFMCYNLGAENSGLDPFSYNNGNINGDLYQWGRKKDGHEQRTSLTTTTVSGDINATELNGRFVTTTASSTGSTTHGSDWISYRGSYDRWGNGTSNVNPPKGINDPCPPGWKVPSASQWRSLLDGGTTYVQFSDKSIFNAGTGLANKWVWTGNGFKVGEALYLPAAGQRAHQTSVGGSIGQVGAHGVYWSSTVSVAGNFNEKNYGWTLDFYEVLIRPGLGMYATIGQSVRCVAE